MNFVPDDFVVPEKLVADDFYLRMLTIHDVIKDYDAVMASREKLKVRMKTTRSGLTV